MIGIIGAMDEEMRILTGAAEGGEKIIRGQFHYLKTQIGGHDVVLLKSGIGKVNAAVGTALMIELFSPRMILNTGSAGGVGEALSIGDVVISDTIRHHDVHVTAFGYADGQVPGQPEAFESDSSLRDLAKAAASSAGTFASHIGQIISGDSFINSDEVMHSLVDRFPGSLAVEMESAAIAQTCSLSDIPFLIIRSISDLADNHSPGDFEKNLHIASTHSANTILELLKVIK